jgi:predicted 3-demethylubiquinone-9 3-methyltransferase (glyoxalase superfamily)
LPRRYRSARVDKARNQIRRRPDAEAAAIERRKVMQKIIPCLWFDDQAEEAVRFYTSIFKNSRIGKVAYYGEGAPRPKGSVMTIQFELDGQEFLALNGGPVFHFTEAISLIVNCKSQKELDRIWKALTKGGSEVQCGWLKDKFGLSWQIVPSVVSKMITDPDPDRAERVLKAVLRMKKLDIKALKKAYARR